MSPARAAGVLAALLAALVVALPACGGPKGPADTFVAAGSEVAAWASTTDGRVRVPLARGIAWGPPTPGNGDSTLLKVRGEDGPTFVIVARVDDAPRPLALTTCAVAHADRIAKAVSAAKVFSSPPTVSEERRRGEQVPRVHYVMPLQATGGARGAAALSWWTYYLDGDRCLAIGVTSVVREQADDPKAPDQDDMRRLERVFALLLDGVRVEP